jgi:hypothetical protein
MLTIEILAKLREADRREALLVERIMIAAAQVTIQPENQQRLDAGIVGSAHAGNIAG